MVSSGPEPTSFEEKLADSEKYEAIKDDILPEEIDEDNLVHNVYMELQSTVNFKHEQLDIEALLETATLDDFMRTMYVQKEDEAEASKILAETQTRDMGGVNIQFEQAAEEHFQDSLRDDAIKSLKRKRRSKA